MDSENDSVKSHTESEEDDLGCYFLQPSSAPYNITEKVQQANVDLFNTQENRNVEKTAKVKFRELISFEPDLTDDDVNSIESDRTELSLEARPTILEYKTTINSEHLTIFNIEEDVEELDEVLEDVDSDTEYKPEIKVSTAVAEKTVEGDKTASSRKESSKRKRMSKSKAAFLNPQEVNCKDHCVDRLDYDLSVSIRKLEIQDKLTLPPLQLLQRKCCDEAKKKIHLNLPQYNGLRSEYGLTSRQLEKREKQKEMLKMRDRLHQQLMEEYKRRKIQQNEEVFCQWLKEVSKRKSEKKSTNKRAASAKLNSGVSKPEKKITERPKTANAFVPRTKPRKKRRPQSTNARVYIEVPRSCLEKHLRIGDLTITNSKLFSRNVHIITIS
ncbi:uncharacterized protein LOC108914217 [Anoplophora glabripennis]|uniref:uncharacterized protein LOC108914217 n=1 Tax=Anoplophora glabripennis TaxID=217634 RepID=UPI000873D44F|nr:uncharacterized protein LOC108914217 [Anoplophora glabripennis]